MIFFKKNHTNFLRPWVIYESMSTLWYVGRDRCIISENYRCIHWSSRILRYYTVFLFSIKSIRTYIIPVQPNLTVISFRNSSVHTAIENNQNNYDSHAVWCCECEPVDKYLDLCRIAKLPLNKCKIHKSKTDGSHCEAYKKALYNWFKSISRLRV